MDCPVSGCMANNDGKLYGGKPVCMQAFCGDPEAFRQSTRGCIMANPAATVYLGAEWSELERLARDPRISNEGLGIRVRAIIKGFP